jgi:hypothetical protein
MPPECPNQRIPALPKFRRSGALVQPTAMSRIRHGRSLVLARADVLVYAADVTRNFMPPAATCSSGEGRDRLRGHFGGAASAGNMLQDAPDSHTRPPRRPNSAPLRRFSVSLFYRSVRPYITCPCLKMVQSAPDNRYVVGWRHAPLSGPKRIMSYKRNQIEEAIARVSVLNYEKSPLELRTRIKRLLELDRSRGRKLWSKDPEQANFAFFSDDAPGTGVDISFSEYDAFSLLNALRLMGHSWPQGFAVAIMRRVRPALESEHARILTQDPAKLFDQQAIRAGARSGDIYVDNTDPVFLVLASKAQRAADEPQPAPLAAVCRGLPKVRQFSREMAAWSVTTLEVVTLAHRVQQELTKTAPRRRGRG